MRVKGVNLAVVEDEYTVGVLHAGICAGRLFILVVPGMLLRKAARIFASVAVSTALVESSRMSTLGFFSRARGDAEPLLLAAGDVVAAALYAGVVAVREAVDELVGAGGLAGCNALLLCCLRIAPAKVF